MLKRLFFPDQVGLTGSAGLLALRLIAGSAFLFHGWPKIQRPRYPAA